MKCSLDVFYFWVPFTLAEVLQLKPALDVQTFKQTWMALGNEKQVKPKRGGASGRRDCGFLLAAQKFPKGLTRLPIVRGVPFATLIMLQVILSGAFPASRGSPSTEAVTAASALERLGFALVARRPAETGVRYIATTNVCHNSVLVIDYWSLWQASANILAFNCFYGM